jgi:D-threo-aldose 1-dehydrogenase
VLARARVLAAVCERHGVSLPDAAIQFPLRHPAVVSVVSGMRSGEQVASTLDRFATVVPDEVWTELDAC